MKENLNFSESPSKSLSQGPPLKSNTNYFEASGESYLHESLYQNVKQSYGGRKDREWTWQLIVTLSITSK